MGADVQGWQGRLPAVPKLDVPVVGGGQHVALLAVPSGLERSIGTAESQISIRRLWLIFLFSHFGDAIKLVRFVLHAKSVLFRLISCKVSFAPSTLAYFSLEPFAKVLNRQTLALRILLLQRTALT